MSKTAATVSETAATVLYALTYRDDEIKHEKRMPDQMDVATGVAETSQVN